MQPRLTCTYRSPMDPKLRNNFLHRKQGRASKALPYVIVWLRNYLVLSTYQTIRLPLHAQPHYITAPLLSHTLLSHYNYYTYTCRGYIFMQTSHLTPFIHKNFIFLLCYSCNCVQCVCRRRTRLATVLTYQERKKLFAGLHLIIYSMLLSCHFKSV